MPTLTSGIIAAQLPSGEYPLKIESYLGYLVIGTNKGVRVASISEGAGSAGDLSYGPLISNAKNETIELYSGNAGSYDITKPIEMVKSYLQDIKQLLSEK